MLETWRGLLTEIGVTRWQQRRGHHTLSNEDDDGRELLKLNKLDYQGILFMTDQVRHLITYY